MEQDTKDLLASRMNPFLIRSHPHDLCSVMDVNGGTNVAILLIGDLMPKRNVHQEQSFHLFAISIPSASVPTLASIA